MKLDNQGFGEAVRSLAQRAGMQPYHFTKEDEKQKRELGQPPIVQRDASRFATPDARGQPPESRINHNKLVCFKLV